MGSIPDARARCWRTWSGGWRGPRLAWRRLRPPPSQSLGLHLLSLAGLGLSDSRLDARRPERHPGAVVHGPGLGDQAGDLDRVALADARGQAGDLDGQDLGLALGQGD